MDESAKYLLNKFSLANLVPYDQRDLYQQFPHNAKTLENQNKANLNRLVLEILKKDWEM